MDSANPSFFSRTLGDFFLSSLWGDSGSRDGTAPPVDERNFPGLGGGHRGVEVEVVEATGLIGLDFVLAELL